MLEITTQEATLKNSMVEPGWALLGHCVYRLYHPSKIEITFSGASFQISIDQLSG